MASVVIITHEFDTFLHRRRDRSGELDSPYLLFGVLKEFTRMGHDIWLGRGLDVVEADAAFLHVDATYVDDDYLALAAHYRTAINFGPSDISKRKVSPLLLSRDSDWTGPVLVKANLNCQGKSEQILNRKAVEAGKHPPYPDAVEVLTYRQFNHIDEVASETWDDPSLVVEKFMPEPAPEGGFVTRSWVFLGPRERCTRLVTADPISKGAKVLHYEPTEVPDEIRAERERLGFDYGKFDFVISDGTPYLLDPNKTPGAMAPALQELFRKGARNLALGLHELLVERGIT